MKGRVCLLRTCAWVGLLLISCALLVDPARAAELTGEWSGAYEFHNEGQPVTYVDLLVVLKGQAGQITGSAGPHEYEQYGIDNVKATGETLTFEVYRGNVANTYFSLSFSGDHAEGQARIERPSGIQIADVLLDRVPLRGATPKPEHVDLQVMNQIRREGLERSQVMDGAWNLTEQYGPRLTGSRNFRASGDWLVKQLSTIGLINVTEEPIPNPYPGWELERFTIQQLEPTFAPLLGAPPAWATSTPGRVSGEAVMLVPTVGDSRDSARFFDRYRGRLQGKFILIDQPQTLPLPVAPIVSRFTADELLDLTKAPKPVPPPERRVRQASAQPENSVIELSTSWLNQPSGFVAQLFEFLKTEKVAALVQEGRRLNAGGVVRAMGVRTDLPPTFVLASEHYNRIARLVQHAVPVRLELDLSTRFYDSSPNSFNVIGEIPGTRKKDEIVMLGAHLDSWAAGTGATDNAAGCAIVLEALRILQRLNLKMDRTVRAAFWGAEETGTIGGSTAYVKAHLADLESHSIQPEYNKLSVYFNVDSGTGKIRGAYLEGFEGARPAVEAWFQPFQDLGVSLIGRRISFGSDQAPFVRAGLPVIYPEQDPLDFETRTNHTNMDVYDRLQPDELKQAATVMAAMVYNAAMRDDPIPRKPLLPFQLRH